MDNTKNNEQCCERDSSAPPCACSPEESIPAKQIGRKAPKVVISLIVLVAVVSIVAFKTIGTDSERDSSNDSYDAIGGTSDSLDSEPALSQEQAVNAEQTSGDDVPAQQHHEDASQTEQSFGEHLDSWGDLNTVAADTDAVFVFVPETGNILIDDVTRTAVTDVRQYLESSNIKVGLYTLSYDAPDYSEISLQFELPAIIVASKGLGVLVLPCSSVDEYSLLQAFQACCDTSSGCCPS